MTWQSYDLDRKAQALVLAAKQRDEKLDKSKRAMKEAHKMRMTVAYGLERFWGEHVRLKQKEPNKSAYWEATWKALVDIMKTTGVVLPQGSVDPRNANSIKQVAEQLWGEAAIIADEKGPKLSADKQGPKLSADDQRLALAVLTQLCDCMVWWTQRFKDSSNGE